MPLSDALASLLGAGIAATLGDADRAVEFLCEAERGLEAAHRALYANAARWHSGRLLGGDHGRTLVDAAEKWMRAQRVANPPRMAAMLVPGFEE